jgi:hypothetical protein
MLIVIGIILILIALYFIVLMPMMGDPRIHD